MLASNRFPPILMSAAWMLLAGASAAVAQSAPSAVHGVVSDDMLTLVVGTRFVSSPANELSARAQFTEHRIALETFNDTDRCVDQTALEVAQEYFNTLGRALGKAGHYYFVPDAEIDKALTMCEKMHGRPPQAWVATKTKVLAFGRVVPTAAAPALEQSIR